MIHTIKVERLEEYMLDKIQNNDIQSVIQSQSPDRIRDLGMTNPFEESDKGFFVDESRISSLALEKYQREIDVKNFSDILNQIDDREASELVLKQMYDGILSIDDDEFLAELLSNEDFLNDIA